MFNQNINQNKYNCFYTNEMEKSKIPMPGGGNRTQATQIKKIVKEAPVKSNIVRQVLRRRSKSVTDLRAMSKPAPIDINKLKKPIKPILKPIEERPSNLRLGQKRPAVTKPTDSKPKAAKVVVKKIPDWDYKSRFADLQNKYSALEEQTKQKLSDFEGMQSKLIEANIKLEEVQCQFDDLQQESRALESQNLSLKLTNKKLISENNEMKEEKREHILLKKEYEEMLIQNREKTEKLNIIEKLKIDLEIQLKSTLTKYNYSQELIKEMKIDLQEHEANRRRLHNTIQDLKGNIRVFCRIRPPIRNEADEKLLCSMTYPDECNLEIKKSRESVVNGKQSDLKQEFTFDKVFPPESTQLEIFEDLSELVQSALDGYNVCVFAYGQTGSGKTYTMQGSTQDHGVIPRTIDAIFNRITALQKSNWKYDVCVSFLEIYNENIRDLLEPNSRHNYELRYNDGKGVTVTNLKIINVQNGKELRKLMREAHSNRAVAATDFNLHSSRSHAVTKISLNGHNNQSGTLFSGSISLVDLAGSESAKTTTNERLQETKNINKSLSTLGKVMGALHNKDAHIPYRDSKLTFLLQSCLGGNSKTLMFVNISPFDECYGETINSLRFAAKVKEVKISAKRKCVRL